MLPAVVLICVLGLAAATPAVVRSREQIQEYISFLEGTRTNHGVVLGERAANPVGSAWENSGKYQGDILLDEEQLESMVDQFVSGRNAYILPNTRWPSRTIVYEFADGHFDAAQRNAVLNSIKTLQERTCIKFRPRNPGEFNYVRLTSNPADGCYAHIGYSSGRGVHIMNLARDTPGRGCFDPIVIIHEWLHVIGFYHMQSTHDRDNYVRINWANIDKSMEFNFDRHDTNMVSNLGLPYEYDSCMHYGPYAFSINGKTTIDALKPHNGVMGQRSYVTKNDYLRVDRHYGCAAWRQEADYQPFMFDETVPALNQEEIKLQDE